MLRELKFVELTNIMTSLISQSSLPIHHQIKIRTLPNHHIKMSTWLKVN